MVTDEGLYHVSEGELRHSSWVEMILFLRESLKRVALWKFAKSREKAFPSKTLCRPIEFPFPWPAQMKESCWLDTLEGFQ